MSVCGQSGQTEDDSGSEEVTASAAAVRDIYKQKPASKVVRVLTVLAYLLSVSLAAILLSVYYVCVWKSPELPPLNDTGLGTPARLREEPPHTTPGAANFTGGGDSGVNTHAAPASTNSTDDLSTASVEESTTYPALDEAVSISDTTLPPDALNSTYYSDTNNTDIT